MQPSTKILRSVLMPKLIARKIIRVFHLGCFEFRLDCDAFSRPWYAYGMYRAARLASRLGFKAVSAIEFGVAGGSGLVEMEKLALEMEKLFPVKFELYGFDLSSGLPPEGLSRPPVYMETGIL